MPVPGFQHTSIFFIRWRRVSSRRQLFRRRVRREGILKPAQAMPLAGTPLGGAARRDGLRRSPRLRADSASITAMLPRDALMLTAQRGGRSNYLRSARAVIGDTAPGARKAI